MKSGKPGRGAKLVSIRTIALVNLSKGVVVMFGSRVSRREYDKVVADRDQLRIRLDNVLALHAVADAPTRHWEPCPKHIGTPENRRGHGGWIPLQNAVEACEALEEGCTYVDRFHCTYDSHIECGHEDYPCITARAAQGHAMP
jgi:hypothetical protein